MTERTDARIEVLLITYNHEHYVRRALDGISVQVIDEPIRLVVADDKSTDGTMNIVREFAAAHPQIEVRYLDNTKNHGVTRNYQRAFAACTGSYVAVLEGDDYWISPHKLARQRDFLDVRLECDLCSVNYYVFEEDRSMFTPRWQPGEGHMLLGARQLIADNVVGNFSTCMYRTSALRRLPPAVYDHKSYDWIINILLAQTSMIGFLHEPMSVYRIHGDGVWSLLSQVEKLKVQRELIPCYNDLTGRVFEAEFGELDRRLAHVIDDASSQPSSTPAMSVLGMNEARLRIRDWLPPFMLPFAKAIVPVAVKRMIHRLRTGGTR
jgi:glycosyltransferase involved in cell wall biosynthesis